LDLALFLSLYTVGRFIIAEAAEAEEKRNVASSSDRRRASLLPLHFFFVSFVRLP
jgi:hypothetical protein